MPAPGDSGSLPLAGEGGSRCALQPSLHPAPSLQQMCMINGLFTFCCLIIIFLPLTFSLLQIYFKFEILGIPLITFMFISEVAIIRLFSPFFLILEFNYIFPSAF